MERIKVLIFGSSGMLGSEIYRFLERSNKYELFTVNRRKIYHKDLPNHFNLENFTCDDAIDKIIDVISPNFVINCSGAIKQQISNLDHDIVLPINSIFPNLLSKLSKKSNFKLIHFSTDCVFSGEKGNYLESDPCDVNDLYGLSKFLGEVQNENSLTLRTSIIGHGLSPNKSLIDWFLEQKDEVKGFSKAVFSGLPTIEIANILDSKILGDDFKGGLYNLSAEPISKYDLLCLVKERYKKNILIINDTDILINRSLNSEKFRDDFSYCPPSWNELIKKMHDSFNLLQARDS